jgi:hypothetical protein
MAKKRKTRQRRRLIVSFVRATSRKKKAARTHGRGKRKRKAMILSNDTKGLNLTIQETIAATGAVVPSAGPFAVDVQDPGSTVTVTPGSPDQATPTNFKPNGSGAVGTVTVKVTDTSNGLVGSASFDVVAPTPPPPAKADTLTVGFVAAP